MATEASVTQALIKALSIHLQATVKGLANVYDDWPAANEVMKYPSVSIFSGTPAFQNGLPYVVYKSSSPDANNRYTVRKCVGSYEIKLQLDLWLATKFERHRMQELMFRALNPNGDFMGINLQLTDYYGEWAHLHMDSFQVLASEAEAQRREWRIKFSVIADVKAILESSVYLMQNIENNLETPELINPLQEPASGSII